MSSLKLRIWVFSLLCFGCLLLCTPISCFLSTSDIKYHWPFYYAHGFCESGSQVKLASTSNILDFIWEHQKSWGDSTPGSWGHLRACPLSSWKLASDALWGLDWQEHLTWPLHVVSLLPQSMVIASTRIPREPGRSCSFCNLPRKSSGFTSNQSHPLKQPPPHGGEKSTSMLKEEHVA